LFFSLTQKFIKSTHKLAAFSKHALKYNIVHSIKKQKSLKVNHFDQQLITHGLKVRVTIRPLFQRIVRFFCRCLSPLDVLLFNDQFQH
jgi:hypothetical protein